MAAVQTTATPDRGANLSAAAELVAEACDRGADLVVLPEYFSVAGTPAVLQAEAEALDGPTVTWAAEQAGRHRVWVVVGSFPERATGNGDGRPHNTSCLVDPAGGVAAVYRKIHLFDVAVGGAGHRESDGVAPGDALAGPVRLTGAGGDDDPCLGLTVCYDLRFPEVYRELALAGATVVTVPAAFTAVTGPPHWEVLLRARAIENELFVVAAGQVGSLPKGMPAAHGHSMVVDPWGVVLAERADPTPGVVMADLDGPAQDRIRRDLPVLEHRRPAAYRVDSNDNREREFEHGR